MLNGSRFDLLLKSYCRTASFSRAQAADFCKIDQERFKQLSSFPVHLPEIAEVQKIIKYLKIPKDIVWQSYFNSVIKVFYHQEEVVIVPYDEYEVMVRNNKKLRPAKQSLPSDELWISLGTKREWPLLGFDLATYLKHSLDHGQNGKPDPSDRKELLKFLQDRLELKPEQITPLLKGAIPSTELLTHLAFRVATYNQPQLLEAYLVTVIKKLKLNYKIEFMTPGAYEQLLNQIYP
jgi:hypothetical protein